MTETMEEEELGVLAATRSPHGYLVSQLTENIHITDEGYLVIVAVPVARTGWQKYSVGDLPKETAKKLGIDVSDSSATIDLYRPAKEVFDPEFLASLNGKPITDGHPPGGDFVDPENYQKYSCGHIQNVRKGPEPLEDGEWPIIADLVITVKKLIDKVINKTARENSLGYDFGIARDGERIIQCNMLGNHNAVVTKGRAGDFVRIDDAAPESDTVVEKTSEIPVPVAEIIETIEYPPINLTFTTKKEKQPVAEKKQSWLRSLMGKHLIEKARATDADPEKIMDEVEAMQDEPLISDKARAKDDAETPKDTEKNEFKSDDKKGKDENEDGGAMDSKRMHDALDSVMGKDKSKAKDSYGKLKKLLDEFEPEEKKEEKKKEEKADDASPAEFEKELAGEDAAEKCPDCGEAHDSEECPGEKEDESGEEELGDEAGDPDTTDPDDDEDQKTEDKSKAKDRTRAADGALAALKFMRPVIARTGDADVKARFNVALASATRRSRVSSGGYDKFATSARVRDKAPRNPNPDRARAGDSSKADPIATLQAFYDNAAKGGK